MIIKSPKTLKDWKEVEQSILEMMGNPYTDCNMFDKLQIKLGKCRQQIKLLKNDKSLGNTF